MLKDIVDFGNMEDYDIYYIVKEINPTGISKHIILTTLIRNSEYMSEYIFIIIETIYI